MYATIKPWSGDKTLTALAMCTLPFPCFVLQLIHSSSFRLTEALANYDPILNEYFFDRHPGVFAQASKKAVMILSL